MVRVGVAGIGFMGVTHFEAWEQVPDAQVTAIFTRDEKKLRGDWSGVQGNFGGPGQVRDLGDIHRHRDLGDLIADEAVDLIDICLPTGLHPDAVVRAVEAGKHVVVEKPIALTVEEADRMIDAAAAHGRLLFVAQVLRFWPEWLYLKQLIERGTYGQLVALNLRRVISMPDWSASIADLESNGGPLIDLHIHDADFLLYLLGQPARVVALGQHREGFVNYVAALYDYPGGPTVSCQGGAVTMKGRMFHHEYEACFERATVVHAQASEPEGVDAAAGQSASQVLTVYHPDGQATFPGPPEVPDTPAFTAQLSHIAECVGRGEESPLIGARSARNALELVLLERRSVLEGRTVEVGRE